jgi:hypothetical protein
MTAKQYLRINRIQTAVIARAKETIELAREAVVIPPLDRVRPATPKDIRMGAVIYHRVGTNDAYWHVVEEVHSPSDPFKAYTADDGCRYGLDHAFVDK